MLFMIGDLLGVLVILATLAYVYHSLRRQTARKMQSKSPDRLHQNTALSLCVSCSHCSSAIPECTKPVTPENAT